MGVGVGVTFNPTLVRLRRWWGYSVYRVAFPFNPTLVRLRPRVPMLEPVDPIPFQSHAGSIEALYA